MKFSFVVKPLILVVSFVGEFVMELLDEYEIALQYGNYTERDTYQRLICQFIRES